MTRIEPLSLRLPRPLHANGGFSLLEIMIGLLVASISAVMILQVFLLFDAQRRTAMSGDDAQSTGAIGFYTLQRDVRQGGYGINAFNLIGCDVVLPSGISLASMAPVTINPASIPAGDSNTDTVMVVYGSNRGGPGGSLIRQQIDQTNYRLDSVLFFATGDYVIAEPMARPSPCSGPNQLKMEAATVADPNVTVATGSLPPPRLTNGTLYNLGPAPSVLVYAVRGGKLTVCDYWANNCGADGNAGDATVWKPIADNIVSLRAQYGRDTTSPMDPAADPTVDVWDRTTPPSESGTTKNNCDWVRISALRLVVVARSGQPVAGDDTTANNPVWAGSTDDPIDLSATNVRPGFNWHKYRYKVFETTIPIRNITLMGTQLGC